MNTEYAIEVNNIKKKFKIYHDKGRLLKDRLFHASMNKYEERWVLNGVSFNVKKGEAVGLIGHNGCGKSTTLKLLTRIMYPDSGRIRMNGRVSSLLELGAGFHPDLSGRENIYINASIFGLTKKEIDERIEKIIEFSELEEFIDNPVRTYSSGMYMRLAFSVAINVDADILLIDEILAVGDANFQIKCYNKLFEIKRKGTTIVIVSHSLGQIEQICDKSIWIHEGLVRKEGTPKTVHEEYLKYMGELRREHAEIELAKRANENEENTNADDHDEEDVTQEAADSNSVESVQDDDECNRMGTGDARYKRIRSYDSNGREKYAFAPGDTIIFKMDYKVYRKVKDAYFGISIFRNDGIRCYGTNSKIDSVPFRDLNKDGTVIVEFKDVNLLSGQYYLDVSIEAKEIASVDYWSNVNTFEIVSSSNEIGIICLKHEWR